MIRQLIGGSYLAHVLNIRLPRPVPGMGYLLDALKIIIDQLFKLRNGRIHILLQGAADLEMQVGRRYQPAALPLVAVVPDLVVPLAGLTDVARPAVERYGVPPQAFAILIRAVDIAPAFVLIRHLFSILSACRILVSLCLGGESTLFTLLC